GRAPSGAVASRGDERREQRVGTVGTALELRMRLRGDEERVQGRLQLHELDETVVGGRSRADHAGILERAAVPVVELVAVPVTLVDDLLAVRRLDERSLVELGGVRAEPHRAAEVDD